MRRIFLLAHLPTLLLITSCGGGSSANQNTSTSSFSQTYSASALAGEVLSYTFDASIPSSRQYSYSVSRSAYGLGTSPQSGSLTPDTGGAFHASNARLTNTRVYAVKNAFAVGTLNLPFVNGATPAPKDVAFLGLSNVSTSATYLGATQGNPVYYNFLSLRCSSKSYGVIGLGHGCATSYGSLKLETISANSPDYVFCPSSNLATGACTQATRSGRLEHLGNGIWRMTDATQGYAALNVYLMLSTAPNGQRVGLIDFNEAGGFGYGQAVIAEQRSVQMSAMTGTYFYADEAANTGDLVIDSSQLMNGLAFTADSPWTGFATHGALGNQNFALLSSGGFMAYRNRSSSVFGMQIAVKKNL